MATVHTRVWHAKHAVLPTLSVVSDILAKGVGMTLYFISVRDGFFLFSLFFHIIFSNVERAVHIADARARLHARSRGIRNAIRPA